MFCLGNDLGKFSFGLLIYCITPLTFTASTNKICSNLERDCLTRFHLFVIVMYTGINNALEISTTPVKHFEATIKQFS